MTKVPEDVDKIAEMMDTGKPASEIRDAVNKLPSDRQYPDFIRIIQNADPSHLNEALDEARKTLDYDIKE